MGLQCGKGAKNGTKVHVCVYPHHLESPGPDFRGLWSSGGGRRASGRSQEGTVLQEDSMATGLTHLIWSRSQLNKHPVGPTFHSNFDCKE